jgi:teichuronic acid exporter
MSLAKQAGRAFYLMFFRRVWGALMSFAIMAYLARTLDKSDFGVVAISAVLLQFIQLLAISGIGEYLIFYQENDKKKVYHSAFWLNIFLAIVICAVVLILLPFWTGFYDDPRIYNITLFLLFSFFFNVLCSLPNALFRKELNYKPMILIQTVFGTLNNLGQLAAAIMGLGVYSLVLPNAILMPFMAFFTYYASGFKPVLKINTSYWKPIFKYTRYVIMQRVLGKFINEGDTFIVGKFFGMNTLGVYNLAFQFSNLFTGYFLPLITNITLPVFAKNNRDIPVVKNHYLRMIQLISVVSIPVITLMIINAKFLITTLYGSRWEEAVVIFQLLSFFMMVKTLSSPTNGLFNALGYPQKNLYFMVYFVPIFLLSIYLGASTESIVLFTVILVVVRILGSLFLMRKSLSLIDANNISSFHDILVTFLLSIGISLPVLFLKVSSESALIFSVVYVLLFTSYYFVLRKSKFYEIKNELQRLFFKK